MKLFDATQIVHRVHLNEAEMAKNAINSNKSHSLKLFKWFDAFDYLQCSRALFDVNHNFIGWPCYNEDFLWDHFSPNDQSDSEFDLKEYASLKKYSGKMTNFRLIWLFTSSFVAIKDIWAVMFTVMNVSQFSLARESFVVNRSNTETIHNFACVQTNCNRIRPNTKLSTDLVALPMFKICKSHWVPFFTPYPDLKAQGVMILSMWGYAIWMTVLLSLYLYLHPCPINLFTFMIAPKSCRRRIREKCKLFLIDVKISEINFTKQSYRTDLEQMRHVSELNKLSHYNQLFANIHKLYPSTIFKVVDKRSYLDECIPLVRTDWWHDLLAKQFFWLVVILMTIFYNLALCGLFYSTYVMFFLDKHLSQIDQLLNDQNCSIWIADRGTRSSYRQPIRFTGLAPSWNFCTLVEIIIACTPVFVILTINLVQLFISLKEICSWIDELMDQVRIAIAICEFRLMRTNMIYTCEQSLPKPIGNFLDTQYSITNQVPIAISALKELQKNNLKSLFSLKCFECVMNHSCSKRKHNLYTNCVENLLIKELELYSDHGLRVHVEVMEKIYISIRLLIVFVKDSSTNMTILMVFLHIINYGFILQLVYLNKKFTDSQLFPLIFALTVIILLDYIITLASNIQAQSRHLIDLIWQLIAVNTHFKDVQTSHAKHLMTKLVIMLSQSNGIMFNVLGVPITYASLLRLTLWSTSLTMLVFN